MEIFLLKKKQISKRSKIQTHVLLNPFKSNQLGRPPVLSEEIEKLLVDALIKLADWGFELTKIQTKQFIQNYSINAIVEETPQFIKRTDVQIE